MRRPAVTRSADPSDNAQQDQARRVIALMRSQGRNLDEPVRSVTVPTECIMRGTITPPPVNGL